MPNRCEVRLEPFTPFTPFTPFSPFAPFTVRTECLQVALVSETSSAMNCGYAVPVCLAARQKRD